ncbi:MAG: AAA family ATPase [Campylobacterota bacterium]|nr:AAA family ATPase [Campylobacterota bacterium]
MTLDGYHGKINEQKELDIRNENLVEVLKYYVLFSNIDKLSFFEYDYDLNDFVYDFSVDSQKKFVDDSISHGVSDNNYSVVIEENETIYGMITFDEDPGTSETISELFIKIKEALRKRFSLSKELLSQESALDLYIITDENSTQFAHRLENSLGILLNANISVETTISSIHEILKEKIKKSILVYCVEDSSLLRMDEELLKKLNEFLFVIGPSDYDTSLFCGQLNVYKYLSKDEFLPEQLKSIIVETKNQIQNKYISKNKIIAISGITGGIGTTTIAMNTANMLAKRNHDKNVLFIDLSATKAISNLFLGQNPLPKKTIIDLVNSAEFDIEKHLKNGLVKVRENFYSINGIQKHIDSDFLEKDVFIEKLLNYISKASEEFNFIIIDTGEANATPLNTTIYDIVNELWVITEMSLPHISKLKTFFSLIKRAGLKDKVSFMVNRYDSVNAISVSDVTSILNTTGDDYMIRIPNDYSTLGHCWNYCELATDSHPHSAFVDKLEDILKSKNFFNEEQRKARRNGEKKSKSLFSFFK